MAKRRKRWPTPGPGAELIVKERFFLQHERDNTTLPLPEMLLLGNQEGFRYLARMFAYMAEREVGGIPSIDPDDHQHIPTYNAPFNLSLSDVWDIRIGSLTDDNRRAVFKYYGISRKVRKKGSIIDRHRELDGTVMEYLDKQTGRANK